MVDVAKAGWLMRQSSFLKKWKQEWFALTVDGFMRYFKSPDSLEPVKTICLSDLVQVKTGAAVEKVTPPVGYSADYLLQLITRENQTWTLCAEGVDDMLAWQMAIEQGRVYGRQQLQQQMQQQQLPSYLNDVLINNPNNGYPMYYRGNGPYRGNYPSRIVQTPQGPITVIYINDPYYCRRGRYGYYGYGGGGGGGSDIALGALAGTAIASTLFWPFWFPLFWC